MTSDLDIYRSAHELIKQHGEAADIEAAMRADELMEAGDGFTAFAGVKVTIAVEPAGRLRYRR